MKYHAYVSITQKGNEPKVFYAYCGQQGTQAKKSFYSPEMFCSHYAKELACKKCSAIVSPMVNHAKG